MLVSLPIYIDAIDVLEVSVTCILQLSGYVYISLETSKTSLRVQPLTLRNGIILPAYNRCRKDTRRVYVVSSDSDRYTKYVKSGSPSCNV